jgi:hypothetical protein
VSDNGWFLSYAGHSYSSASALQAYRDSTGVNAGQGTKNQIDHMSNFSFDWGNAHFLFLDANPHLFNAQVDYSNTFALPPAAFPDYPSMLRRWGGTGSRRQ